MPLNSGHGPREFGRLCRLIEFSSPIIPLIATLAYLALAIDLPRTQWICLVVGFAVYTIVAGVHRLQNREGRIQRISSMIEDSTEGPESDQYQERLSSIQAELLALPLEMRRTRFISMLVLGLAVPVAMTLIGFSGWFSSPFLQNHALSILVAALATSTLQFYWSKSAFRSIRQELGGDLPISSDTGGHIQRTSLGATLQFSILMPAMATLMLTLSLMGEAQRRTAESEAATWSGAVVASVAESAEMLELAELYELVEQRNAVQAGWPMPIELKIHSLDAVDLEGKVDYSTTFLEALDARISNGDSGGTLNAPHARELGAFHRLDDTTFLVAAVERDRLGSSVLAFDASLALLIAGMFAFVWGLARLVSRDLQTSISDLEAGAEKLARGGFVGAAAFETGDELGALGRGVHVVGLALQEIRQRVSNAIEKVEQTASDSLTLAEGLTHSGVQQSERLQHAMDLIVSIDARGCEVAQSAETLNSSVDESSSSIAELGAAGAELNETASVLSSKVDEVSNSMEQMVRSVKQVGATTEKLAGASEETSSSMEEMASAMRVVDTSAESMANLSLDVVEKAEVGQAKVCQTIEGMEAIREATDAAERVIRGLGSRTLEIGGILDVIDDVADETNLLALNAAIIAAQAGEQGKAFSVVADQIKELADRVLASTKEIGGLIRSVQEESENAIGAIEAGSQSVMSGVDLSAEAGRTLEEITDASRQNGMRIGEIVSSVREQTKAAGHVVELMEKVRDSADEISSASSEQDQGNEIIYRSALTMREVAQQVRRTTEEQSRGFGRIRESVEGVRSTVDHITGSLREQAGSCGEVSSSLDAACAGTRSNEDAYRKLGEAMKTLLAETEALREDAEQSQSS